MRPKPLPLKLDPHLATEADVEAAGHPFPGLDVPGALDARAVFWLAAARGYRFTIRDRAVAIEMMDRCIAKAMRLI